MQRRIEELDSAAFAVRGRATQGLQKLGNAAAPALEKALAARPTAEKRRRIEGLLDKLHGIDLAQLQMPAGISVIETMDLAERDRQRLNDGEEPLKDEVARRRRALREEIHKYCLALGKGADRNRAVLAPPESAHVAATVSPGKAGRLALRSPPGRQGSATDGRERFRERPLEQRVADAQVIVVARALESAPAPPKSPGDLPEVLIRFQVKRVLKGNLAAKKITTRTPTAAAEFIGKEWVILLSAEYVAGKHQFADCEWIKAEAEVKAILDKDKK